MTDIKTIKSDQKETWRALSFKDKANYLTAFFLIGSGILIAFLSFFLNHAQIESGVLLYIAQAFLVGGSLLGLSLYFKSKWIEFNNLADSEIKQVKKIISEIKQ